MPTVVNSTTTTFSSGFGASPRSATIPFSATVGNALFVRVDLSNENNNFTLADNEGNTYDLLYQGVGAYAFNRVYVCRDVAASPTTITVTWPDGGNAILNCHAVEVSGLATAGSPALTSATPGTTTSLVVSTTTSAADDFVFGSAWIVGTLDMSTASGVGGMTPAWATGTTNSPIFYGAQTGAPTTANVGLELSASKGTNIIRAAVFSAAASAATLSSPTSASVTQTGATIGATTDDATGTLYGVVTTSASAPSATQIKAGQDHTGSAAAGSGSNASLSVGANTIAITGLTAATSYYYYLVQDSGADSNVVNGTFTTAVAAPVLTSPTAVSIGTTTVTPRVTTDTGNGTCYYVITPQAESEPSNTQVEAGTNAADGAPVASGSQVVSSAGVITFSEVTGLTAGTAYRISYAHSGTPS